MSQTFGKCTVSKYLYNIQSNRKIQQIFCVTKIITVSDQFTRILQSILFQKVLHRPTVQDLYYFQKLDPEFLHAEYCTCTKYLLVSLNKFYKHPNL